MENRNRLSNNNPDNYRSMNQKNMIAYFEKGIKKPDHTLMFGVEIEHFVVDKRGNSISYYGVGGIEQILHELSEYYPYEHVSEGHLIGLYSDEMSVSLEPAAQMEVSIAPRSDTADIVKLYEKFRSTTEPVLEKYGLHLVTEGYQPASLVNELSLIPKKRYELMDRYFQKIGIYGRQMMRGTASAQISIDYYSEEDFSRKYKIAYQMRPVLYQLCANTTVYEGKRTDSAAIRKQIWEGTDPLRVDVAPYLRNGTLDFSAYSEFVMNAPVIVLLLEDMAEDQEQYCEKTIGQLFEERIFEEREMEHVLSMVFPMIRLKNYMEIRIADSMPIASVRCYALLIKGIFTDCDRFEEYLKRLAEKKLSVFEDMDGFYQIVSQGLLQEERDYLSLFRERMIKEGTII